MDARDVKSAGDAKALVEARGLSHVKLGVVDLDGVIRGKYIARDKFFAALESGFNFCDVIFGWDCQDQLYDKAAFTGWHTAYPDAMVRIVPESCREIRGRLGPERRHSARVSADRHGAQASRPGSRPDRNGGCIVRHAPCADRDRLRPGGEGPVARSDDATNGDCVGPGRLGIGSQRGACDARCQAARADG